MKFKSKRIGRSVLKVCNIEWAFHQLFILKLYTEVHALVGISDTIMIEKSAMPHNGGNGKSLNAIFCLIKSNWTTDLNYM